jgi:hypothetical protein
MSPQIPTHRPVNPDPKTRVSFLKPASNIRLNFSFVSVMLGKNALRTVIIYSFILFKVTSSTWQAARPEGEAHGAHVLTQALHCGLDGFQALP